MTEKLAMETAEQRQERVKMWLLLVDLQSLAIGPLPETFMADLVETMEGCEWETPDRRTLAEWAIWYRLGFHAARGVSTQTPEAPEVPLRSPQAGLRLVYAVLDEIQGQVTLTIRGSKETVQAIAPMFSRPLTVVARDGDLWISPVQTPEAPEAPQNPTHKPTHGSTP